MGKVSTISAKRYFAFVALATLANVVLFFIGQSLGATYDVNAPMPVDAGIVIGMSVAQLSVGFLFAWLVSRFSSKLFGALVWVGVAFALISAPGGWVMSADAATGVALGLMHVTGAVAWFYGVKSK